MIRVSIAGARGRMGSMLVDLVRRAQDLQLCSAVEHARHPDLGQTVGDGVVLAVDAKHAMSVCDVFLDFSLPASVVDHTRLAVELKKPFVTGTTGFTEKQIEVLNEASKSIALVLASNFSRGVWVANQLVKLAASLLPATDYDAEIFEIHHRHKVDSPSGTALLLAKTIQEQRGGESVYGRKEKRGEHQVGLSAARGGDVVGEHQSMFFGPGEQIVLTHRATTREHFCRGALDAVRFVPGRSSGLYSAGDVFGSS